MNIDNGELRTLTDVQMKELCDEQKKRFIPVPDELKDEAIKALDGRESAIVDLKENTPLANWAKQERRHRAKTNREKMAKASRRRNRR